MTSWSVFRRLSFFLLLGLIVGCGSKDIPPGELVSGTVTIKGKAPGTYATLEFVSASDPSKKGGGSVDPTGKFNGQAPEGRVKVAIKVGMGPTKGASGPQFPKGGPPPGQGNPYGPGAPGGPPTPGAPGPDGGKMTGPPKMAGAVEIPANAQDPQKSGVEIDVPKGGAKELTIDFK
ncbi:MAG: hypothetical protein SNJ82_07675 [Gemmataceae bacterium]